MPIDATYLESGRVADHVRRLAEEGDAELLIWQLVDPGDVGSFKLIYANKETSRSTGVETSQFIGKTMREAFPDLLETDLPAHYAAVLRSGHPTDLPEIRHGDAILPERVYRLRVCPLETDTVGVVIIDATDQERYRLEAQLRQAQKMEAVGRLAGGVAHDFNNLLTAISSFGSFARDSLHEHDPTRRDIEEVLDAAKRAEGLTRQLLAFSAKRTIEPRVLNVNDTVRNLERMLTRILGEDVELLTVLTDDPWNTRIDPGALEQVLVNVAVNARDAMPAGGKLTIETGRAMLDDAYANRHGVKIPPGDFVLIAVSDDGIGMPPSTQRRIFEPFFTTKPYGVGSGLGLSTCYGIVKQAGGYIWVYSEPDRGTTFKIYLPRTTRRADKTATRPDVRDLRGTETILVVEDEAQVRELARRILSRQGYKVLTAETGGDALLTCEQLKTEIHLLLTDVVMPRMGGKELCERVARFRPRMRVLFMSGYTANAIVHHGVLHEGVALLHKPFTPEQLASRVREVLDTDGFYAEDHSRRPRVLLIDDNAALLRAMKRSIEHRCDVLSAVGGRAALELIRGEEFDLILCDIVMPDMGGLELYQEVSASRPEALSAFVFFTGEAPDGFVLNFLEESGRPILQKPLTSAAIQAYLPD